MGAAIVRLSRVVTCCEDCGLPVTTTPVVSRTSSGGNKKYYDVGCALRLGIITPNQVIGYNRRQVKLGKEPNFNEDRFRSFFDRATWIRQ